MRFDIINGKKIFAYGKDAYAEAAGAAAECPLFKLDYEEEIMSDIKVSCYNCQYRRWTADSFQCMKG